MSRPLALAARLFAFPAYVEIEWVTVGDPGNTAADTTSGAVACAYRIGNYEVTNAQYTEFLNAKGIGINGCVSEPCPSMRIMVNAFREPAAGNRP